MPKYSHNYTYLHVYTVWPATIPSHHQGELIGYRIQGYSGLRDMLWNMGFGS